MRLSNKSTFSLASLIVLIALGLVFVGTSVMAHDGTHPVNEAILGDNPATPNTVETDFEIAAAHNGHPLPVLSSDDDPDTVNDGKKGNQIKIVEVDDDTNTGDVNENTLSRTFTLLVDFGRDVVQSATLPAVPEVETDTTQESNPPTLGFTTLVLNALGVEIQRGVTVTAARKADSSSQFIVTIEVAVEAVPDGLDSDGTTENAALDEITVRIRVNETAAQTAPSTVYSLATQPGFDVVPGGASMQSNLLELTLVKDLGTDPAPTNAVVDTIAAGPINEDAEVVFTITFNKALLAAQSFRLGDIESIAGGRAVDFDAQADGKTFLLTVEADDPTQPITVTVGEGDAAVSATSDPEEEEITAELDINVVAPDAPTADGKLVFTITSTVDITPDLSINDFDINTEEVDSLASGDLVKTADADLPDGIAEQYMLTVTPKSGVTSVLVELRAGARTYDHDGDGSAVDGTDLTAPIPTPGVEARYSPETGKPSIAFAAVNLDDSGLAQAPGDVDSVDGAMVTITATDSIGLAGNAEIVQSEVTVVNGSIRNFVKGSTATFTLIPDIGKLEVQVKVGANVVHDNAGNGNSAADSAKYTVGPTFTIPANSIMVITKTMGLTSDYLSDQPRLPINQTPPTPVGDISTDVWHNMPDMEVLFSLTGGGNGGTINLTEALGQDELPQTRDGNKQQKNSVRISEVMWAVDLSLRGALNDAEAAEQWIEISNDTGSAVKIFLFARTGLDSAINVDNAEDRVGNAYNGGRGSASWTVPGNNGNSYTGVNFVSMHRKYTTGDNRGYENGTSSGNWYASDREYLTLQSVNPNDGALYNYVGSPGRRHSIGLPRPHTKAGTTQVPSSPVIINEVANRDSNNAEYEWIELRNVTGSKVNLRNWMISMAYKDGDNLVDRPLVQFPNNSNAQVEANDVILILASDPRYDDDHPIAVGYNVDVNSNNQVDGLGLNVPGSNRKAPRQKVQTFENGGMPDGGDFILILRKHDNYENHRSGQHGGKGVAETGGSDVDKIIDIAGSHRSMDASNYPGTNPSGLNNTTLWPLVNFNNDMKPHYGDGNLSKRRHNRLEENRVRYRQHVKTTAKNDHDGGTPGNRAGTGTTHKDEHVHHYAMRDANYTGLGYKRTARILSHHNGTPGYDGNSVGNTGIVKATAAASSVTISEIMYSTGPDADNPIYPQWIELYNSSPTDAVNLGSGWRLVFEMLDADGNPMDNLISLSFKDKGEVKTILPQQTVLVVAGNARQANSDSATGIDVFNDNRVFNLFRDIGAGKFGANTRYMFFNPKAFNISLVDKDGKTVDSAGNLDGDDRTSDTNNWELPTGIAADGNRTSIIRVYDAGVARAGMNDAESNVMPIFGTGDKKMKGADGIDAKYSWIPAVNTEREFKVTIKSTWFGDEDDYGTPNNRPGMVLPVQLSFFRPTLEDGEVTVRWTTESELDNAGFNIYRSETRNGEYTQVNTDMIQGAGTTGERSTYKWVDQTAKPGVVYYYQIEDVSFAGERQALATTKLKGLISAKNKLTTRWGELKSQD